MNRNQAVTVVVFCACVLPVGQAVYGADAWPVLLERDGTVLLPAQSSPHVPSPRKVKAYVFYPGGTITNVTAETGLMLSLHNWGGTGWSGTADPKSLANHYNVVAICVDYLNSGKWRETDTFPYDFGYLQALDVLRALWYVFDGLDGRGIAFSRGRIYATGGSGGGNVTLMVNKLAPRTFACVVDLSGMARLSDDIAFKLPGGSRLNARYSMDPSHPNHLSEDGQALRFVGHPGHLSIMKSVGNRCKVIVVHGASDTVCPIGDARNMVANMQAAEFDVEPHFIMRKDLDGSTLTNTGHGIGDRTGIVRKFGDRFLLSDSPDALVRTGRCDFEIRDEVVRYPTPNGAYVISYKAGYPVGRFEAR